MSRNSILWGRGRPWHGGPCRRRRSGGTCHGALVESVRQSDDDRNRGRNGRFQFPPFLRAMRRRQTNSVGHPSWNQARTARTDFAFRHRRQTLRSGSGFGGRRGKRRLRIVRRHLLRRADPDGARERQCRAARYRWRCGGPADKRHEGVVGLFPEALRVLKIGRGVEKNEADDGPHGLAIRMTHRGFFIGDFWRGTGGVQPGSLPRAARLCSSAPFRRARGAGFDRRLPVPLRRLPMKPRNGLRRNQGGRHDRTNFLSFPASRPTACST